MTEGALERATQKKDASAVRDAVAYRTCGPYCCAYGYGKPKRSIAPPVPCIWLIARSDLLQLQASHDCPKHHLGMSWLRTNGVNTNGAAAKGMSFNRLGKKVRPGTFGKIQVG